MESHGRTDAGMDGGMDAGTDTKPDTAAEPRRPRTVTREEAGQKLLQWLRRRLDLPDGLLHRWIRTGQVRVNGGRARAFTAVAEGDLVRVPPVRPDAERVPDAAPDPADAPPLPPLIGRAGDVLAFDKPAGLPTQSGSGHGDSLAARLAAHAAGGFAPAPAHRLDRDVSGVILVGASFEALRMLTAVLRERRAVKEYLAWVRGFWPHGDARLARHILRRETVRGRERMRALDAGAAGDPGDGQEALLVVAPLERERERSLVRIRLLTGRRHQIRAQLAALGHPVLGDGKYGGRPDGPLRLHSLRMILPDGTAFRRLPPWRGSWAVGDAPDAPLPEDAAPIRRRSW